MVNSKSANDQKRKKKRKSYDTNNGIVVYFDGCCNPNPYGHIGLGCYILSNQSEIYRRSFYIEPSKQNSNNVAEYMALIGCLEFLLENGLQEERVNIYGDSELVIKQMSKIAKVHSGLYVEYAKTALDIKKNFKNINFTLVKRENNSIADMLSKKAFEDNNIKIVDQIELINSKSTDIHKISFSFGRYVCQLLSVADLNYVDWVLNNLDFTASNMHIKNALVKNYKYFKDKAI